LKRTTKLLLELKAVDGLAKLDGLTVEVDQAVFYLDESIHSRTLLNQWRERGVMVKHAGEAFPFGTQDEVRLTACGVKGWIVLTRDQRIRRRVLEREAIRLSGAAVFALTGWRSH